MVGMDLPIDFDHRAGKLQRSNFSSQSNRIDGENVCAYIEFHIVAATPTDGWHDKFSAIGCDGEMTFFDHLHLTAIKNERLSRRGELNRTTPPRADRLLRRIILRARYVVGRIKIDRLSRCQIDLPRDAADSVKGDILLGEAIEIGQRLFCADRPLDRQISSARE